MAVQGAAGIRRAFFDHLIARDHALIPRAGLVPREDPTTLFTGSGMQPLIAYCLAIMSYSVGAT
jgi:alanyl-tRNA synthetase